MSDSQSELWDRAHQSDYRISQGGREEESLDLLRRISATLDLILERLNQRVE